MKAIRDWFHREPVLGSQVIASSISALAAAGLAWFEVDLTAQITLAVYVFLSAIGVTIARDKVDGPETVHRKDDKIVALAVDNEFLGTQSVELSKAKALLLKAVLDPGDRQALRKEINQFLGRP